MSSTRGILDAFLPLPNLPLPRQRRRQNLVCANYLPPERLNVQFDTITKRGNFGAVFFGEYSNPNDMEGSSTDVVVKCPRQSDLGRQLYDMEKHSNMKLRRSRLDKTRFPEYLGEVIIPADFPLAPGLFRLGLVWRRAGSGDTLEQYLTTSRIPQLASILGTTATPTPLRRDLTARILEELALIVQDFQSCGIVHR